MPSLYPATPQAAASLRDYVTGGGTLVVGCFSGGDVVVIRGG